MSKNTIRRHAIVFTEPSKTRQSFKDECDVDNIVRQFERTGLITHARKHPGEYFAAPEMDYFTAMRADAEARSAAVLEAEWPTTTEPQEPEAAQAGSEEPAKATEKVEETTPEEGVD